MEKIKKVFNLKNLLLIASLALLFIYTMYSYACPENSLRVPLMCNLDRNEGNRWIIAATNEKQDKRKISPVFQTLFTPNEKQLILIDKKARKQFRNFRGTFDEFVKSSIEYCMTDEGCYRAMLLLNQLPFIRRTLVSCAGHPGHITLRELCEKELETAYPYPGVSTDPYVTLELDISNASNILDSMNFIRKILRISCKIKTSDSGIEFVEPISWAPPFSYFFRDTYPFKYYYKDERSLRDKYDLMKDHWDGVDRFTAAFRPIKTTERVYKARISSLTLEKSIWYPEERRTVTAGKGGRLVHISFSIPKAFYEDDKGPNETTAYRLITMLWESVSDTASSFLEPTASLRRTIAERKRISSWL